MLSLSQAVIVEGKYDKIKLSSIIDAVIITTGGFSVFKDKEKLALIRFYAQSSGVIILTDSDAAGFKIRNYLKGAIRGGRVSHVYIPDIFGKEKRKTVPSKEGKLGVEGIDKDIILEAFSKAGITCSERSADGRRITNIDLFEDGLSGGENSSEKRRRLLSELGLPTLLTSRGMLEILNTMMSFGEYKELVNKINDKG